MLNWFEFEDGNDTDVYTDHMSARRLMALNKDGKYVYTGVYDTTALAKMVRYCYADTKARKGHQYTIAAVVNKMVYWHNWSVSKLTRYVYQGEFYKSINAWQEEMEIGRKDIEAAERFLKDLNALHTEVRINNNMKVKFWMVDTDLLAELLQLFTVALIIKERYNEQPSRSDPRWKHFMETVVPKLADEAEKSDLFRQGLLNLGVKIAKFDLKSAKKMEGGVCTSEHRGMYSSTQGMYSSTQGMYSSTNREVYIEIIQERIHQNEKSFSILIEKGRFQGEAPSGDANASPQGVHREKESGSGGAQSGQAVQEHSPSGTTPERAALVEGGGNKFPREKAGSQEIQLEQTDALKETSSAKFSQIKNNDTSASPSNLPSEPREGGREPFAPHFGKATGSGGSQSVKNQISSPSVASPKTKKRLKATGEEMKYLSVIEAWNSLPDIPNTGEFKSRKLTKHVFDYSGYVSKTVKSILERLVVASQGKLLETYPTITFWTDCPYDKRVVDMKIPVDSFKEVFDVYRQYFEPGRGVEDKLKLETSLDGFLGCYTIRKRGEQEGYFEPRSWLWEVLHRGRTVPAVINYDKYEKLVKQHHSGTLSYLKTVLAASNAEKGNWDQRITRIAAKLLYSYESIYKNTLLLYEHSSKYPAWLEAFSSYETFVKFFSSFINTFAFDDLKPGHFDPGKKMFKAFITHAKEKVGLSLDPTETTAKTIMMNRVSKMYRPNQILKDSEGRQIWYSQKEMDRVDSGEVNPWWDLASMP